MEKNNANKGRAKREKNLDVEEKNHGGRDMMGGKQGDECVPSSPAPGNPIRQQK